MMLTKYDFLVTKKVMAISPMAESAKKSLMSTGTVFGK